MKSRAKGRRRALLICVLLMAGVSAPQAQDIDASDSGRMISLRTAYSTHFDAYAAGPRDAQLGVLLVHDRWGLNERVKTWADRIAALGYRVLAVDLYDGRPVGKPALGVEVWRAIDPVWIEANVDGALAYLQNSQARIVVAGWGNGIGAVGDLARRAPGATVGLILYYDQDTTNQASHLPARPGVPVLDISVARSLVYPVRDAATDRATEEVWQATNQFLSRFAQ